MTASRRRWVLVLVCTVGFVVGLDNLIVTIALPTLVGALGASPAASFTSTAATFPG